MNREIMAVVQRRPENDKISVPSLDGRRSRKGDGMCKKLRRSHFCFFLKPLWMTLLALSTTETTRPMMLSRFYSLIRPLCVPVDAYTFARRVGAGRFGRNVKGVDDDNRVSLLLLMRRSRHCDDDERDLWNAGRRLSFFRLAATPSKRTALPNSPSEADRTKSPSLQLYIAAYSNRPNITLFTNSTTIAEEAIAKNVSPPLNSRRTTNGKSRNSIRAKLHETRQRLVSTVEDDVLQAPPLTQAYCVYLMAECVAHDEWDLVLDVLDLMKRASLRQERSTYVACLQACFQTANAASAREILSAMAVAQIPPEISDYALVILAMCRKDQTERGWWRKALKLLQEVTPLTEASNHSDLPLAAYDAILSCMVEERQWQESLRLLRFMEQQLSRRVDSDNTSAATTTIVEPSVRAQANRTRPALSTYRTVIECCVASNQAEQAVQVLQSCVNTGLTPTLYAFELVIGALSKKLQWRRALQLVDLMEELGVPRTLQIYNFILTSCAKAREAVPAKAVLVRMRQRDAIAPNIISYNSVLSVCASTSRWKDALTILDRAHREPGVTPDVYTYTKYVSLRTSLFLFVLFSDPAGKFRGPLTKNICSCRSSVRSGHARKEVRPSVLFLFSKWSKTRVCL